MVAQNHPDIFEPARRIGNSGDSRAIIGIAADVDSVIFMSPLALAAPQHAADNRRFLPCGDEYRQRLAIFGWRQLLHCHAVKAVIHEQLALTENMSHIPSNMTSSIAPIMKQKLA